jgi:hypothetical protein
VVAFLGELSSLDDIRLRMVVVSGWFLPWEDSFSGWPPSWVDVAFGWFLSLGGIACCLDVMRFRRPKRWFELASARSHQSLYLLILCQLRFDLRIVSISCIQ